jgi:hypothetical protein
MLRIRARARNMQQLWRKMHEKGVKEILNYLMISLFPEL